MVNKETEEKLKAQGSPINLGVVLIGAFFIFLVGVGVGIKAQETGWKLNLDALKQEQK